MRDFLVVVIFLCSCIHCASGGEFADYPWKSGCEPVVKCINPQNQSRVDKVLYHLYQGGVGIAVGACGVAAAFSAVVLSGENELGPACQGIDSEQMTQLTKAALGISSAGFIAGAGAVTGSIIRSYKNNAPAHVYQLRHRQILSCDHKRCMARYEQSQTIRKATSEGRYIDSYTCEGKEHTLEHPVMIKGSCQYYSLAHVLNMARTKGCLLEGRQITLADIQPWGSIEEHQEFITQAWEAYRSKDKYY